MSRDQRPLPQHSPPRRHSVGGERPYLQQLNLMRWLTSIGVVSTHCVENFGVATSLTYGLLLGELHATREVFFVISGLVLTYAYYDRRPFPYRRFYLRRLVWLVIPYLVWTCVYFGMSYEHIGRFSRVTIHPGSLANQLGQLLYYMYYGIGHLYYAAVIIQFCIIFPLVLWFIRRTAPVHLLVLVASLFVQFWLMRRVVQTPHTNRELYNYQLYLVVGAVIGARFEQLAAWAWRLRWLLAAGVVVVIIGVQAYFVHTVHEGVSVLAATDPFQSRYIPLNLATFAALFLLGSWWVSKERRPLLDRIVKGGSDNSFGVYLSHGVALNLVIASASVSRLMKRGYHWPILTLGAMIVVVSSSTLFCSIMARTPLAGAVGRARRRIVGSPPAGRFEPVTPAS